MTTPVTEQNITYIRSTYSRATIKVLVLEWSAAGKLATAVRLDGIGSGNPFVVRASEFIPGPSPV